MITIKLHGILKGFVPFEAISVANCKTLPQVVNYLLNQYPKLGKFLRANADEKMAVIVNGISKTERELKELFLFEKDEVSLLMHIRGSGAYGEYILGVILIVVGVLLWWTGYGTYLIWYGLMMLGGALMSHGQQRMMRDMLNSQTKDSRLVGKTKSSFGFQAEPQNLTSQGNGIPIGYGRVRTGSQVISSSLRAENINE